MVMLQLISHPDSTSSSSLAVLQSKDVKLNILCFAIMLALNPGLPGLIEVV